MDQTTHEVDEKRTWTKYQSYEHVHKVELNVNAIESAQERFSQLLSRQSANAEDLRRFSQEIHEYYVANRETPRDYERKMSSMREIGEIIRKHKRWKFKLFPCGSTVTSLAAKGCDLDVTIWIPHARKYYANESEAAFDILRNIRHFLLIDKEINYKLESIVYVEAKVPILKIKWKKGLEIDLGCSTEMYVSGIQNSYLIRGFSLWDERFAPLCMFVKEWASQNDVKNPTHGGFNSYAMVLLVVHFLQCAVFPPVLPNLQKLFPEKYARNCDGEIKFPVELDFGDRSFPDDFPVMEKCRLSLAELFILFLDYYSRFDFGHHYICMRDAAVRWRDGRDESPRVSEAIDVFIRDPIDDHNPGRTVRDVEYLQDRMREEACHMQMNLVNCISAFDPVVIKEGARSILVYTGDHDELYSRIRSSLSYLVSADRYTVFHLSPEAMEKQPWIEPTTVNTTFHSKDLAGGMSYSIILSKVRDMPLFLHMENSAHQASVVFCDATSEQLFAPGSRILSDSLRRVGVNIDECTPPSLTTGAMMGIEDVLIDNVMVAQRFVLLPPYR